MLLVLSKSVRAEGTFFLLDEKSPNSELHGYPEEGHLFVMQSFDQVFEQVSAQG